MEEEELPPKSVASFFASLAQVWKNFETTRNLVAFFFLGLTNNFGYVIMLSAAHDLLHIIDNLSPEDSNSWGFLRECNAMSTGAVLLANILPCTLVKFVAPFIPLCVHFRLSVVVLTAGIGLVSVAMAFNKFFIITGICLVSFSCGLGESTILAYMVFYRTKNVLSTWSSGTGTAGLLGAFAYSGMIQMGLSPSMTIYMMLIMPLTMAINFWIVIERPMFTQFAHDIADLEMLRAVEDRHKRESHLKRLAEGKEVDGPKTTMGENLKTIPTILLTYTVWYGLVYFFEYFINQGLFELIYIPNRFMDHSSQYRWFNAIYQLGVFISRSSMNLVQIDKIYFMAVFQGLNVIVFLLESIYGFIGSLYLVLAIILWEGLLGGSSYVNSYRRIMQERPREGREFAMAINAIGDSVMISIAGALAIPVHNALCYTRSPYNYVYSTPTTQPPPFVNSTTYTPRS